MLSRIFSRVPGAYGVGLAAAWLALATTPATSKPYLLIDADTGRVIAQSEAGRPWYPASVTKLMTAYLTFHAMRDGRLQPETLLTVSPLALEEPPSKMGFQVGTQVTVDNALKMLMVKSANDMAVVLAEGVEGDAGKFIEMMNLHATRLGMSGTKFVNPNGLPEEGQVTTARDMAILARAIMQEFPEYELYFRIPALRLGKRLLRNHNRLIDRYPGADGMKTGFICSSGFNVVATAKRGEQRLIAVVFGAYSSLRRAEDTARLFEKGFVNRRSLSAILGREPVMLESIENLAGEPIDLREEMCNRRRKRPVAESDFDDDEESEQEAEAPKGVAKVVAMVRKPLLVDLPPSMPPIRVFTGPPQKTPEAKTAASPKSGKGKGKLTADTAQAVASGGSFVAPKEVAAAMQANATKMPSHVPLPRPRPKI